LAERELSIVVGMGTCAISAGAREVFLALAESLEQHGIKSVKLSQTGCIGYCEQEPLVRVGDVTYARVTPDRARAIVRQHVLGGNVIREWLAEID